MGRGVSPKGDGGGGGKKGINAGALTYHGVGYRGTFHGSGLWEGLLKKVNNSMKENVNILHFKTLPENSFI